MWYGVTSVAGQVFNKLQCRHVSGVTDYYIWSGHMAVQMGKYSEIVDVCQQKYILCMEI